MTQKQITIDIEQQTLQLYESNRLLKEYRISTGKNGVGELIDSEKTPRGLHRIYQKIGVGAAANTVFCGRVATGEIYTPELAKQQPGRDWILTRILWLEGQEDHKNRGGQVDTLSRYIYIHGTPDTIELGKPGSRGCIRMRNADIIELFEQVSTGDAVEINANLAN